MFLPREVVDFLQGPKCKLPQSGLAISQSETGEDVQELQVLYRILYRGALSVIGVIKGDTRSRYS